MAYLIGSFTANHAEEKPVRLWPISDAAARFIERPLRGTEQSDVGWVVVGYLARSDAPDPLSGSPAFDVRDAAANASTFARIGPNGPYLCCSGLKPST